MSQESNQLVKTFMANQSVPAYTVVSILTTGTVINWTATAGANVLASIVGVSKDNVSTLGALPVVIGGTAKVQCNASISAGSIVGPVTATAGLIAARTIPTTVTTAFEQFLGIALQNGSTNSVIEVLLQIQSSVLAR